MKVELNKEIETLTKSQTEMKQKMKNSLSLIKSSLGDLTNRMDNIEDRIPELEGKVEEIYHWIKITVKKKRMEHNRNLGIP